MCIVNMSQLHFYYTMKKISILLGLLFISVDAQKSGARQKGDETNAKIVSQSADIDVDGSYKWSFETDNGISAGETAQLKNNGKEASAEVEGSFRYTGPDGAVYEIKYKADEEGFRPEGEHLPVAPPIPPEIVKALEWNEAHPEEDGKTNAVKKG